MLASLLPMLSGAPKPFTEAFEAEFGKRHPAFVEAPTLAQALNAARVAGKFLVVYLPSASPRDEKRNKAFCRTLTDSEVGGEGYSRLYCMVCVVCGVWMPLGIEWRGLSGICVYIYIHVGIYAQSQPHESPGPDSSPHDTPPCPNTKQVIRAMKASFLLWSPPANSPGLKSAAKELRARKQPYLAVVHMNEKPPRKTTVRSLHHFKVRCRMVVDGCDGCG